jgi:hypothetical protein
MNLSLRNKNLLGINGLGEYRETATVEPNPSEVL